MAASRHKFRRPRIDLLDHSRDDPSNIQSLPDLIRFNAQHNPDHCFCKQAEAYRADAAFNDWGTEQLFNIREISMKVLNQLLQACIVSLGRILALPQPAAAGHAVPVALCMESNVGLFIHLAALLDLEIPVLLLSTRLSPSSIRHLLRETKAETILVSPRIQVSLAGALDGVSNMRVTDPYTELLRMITTGDGYDGKDVPLPSRNPRKRAYSSTVQYPLILHSSGTTGHPKPIALSGRYPLVYAACHEFPEDMAVEWANMSTLPLYHGFGLLAPCLSLSVGLRCCFPPSSIISSAQSTIDLLRAFAAGSLMTVPSIMDDLLALSSQPSTPQPSKATRVLRDLEFVAIGGGALNPSTASALAAQGVRLLTHYGVTELGALAPIFCPGADYDWRYVRLRGDYGLRLEPIDDESLPDSRPASEEQLADTSPDIQRFKIIGCPVDSDQYFEIQDEMLRNPLSTRLEVQLLGRRDDLIVLKTGEKVVARLVENSLMADENVSSAVCVGDGYFELVALVEPAASTILSGSELIDHAWCLVQKLNPLLDQHARISSRSAIILKPPTKAIPRSDKGSVMRRAVHDLFKPEIEAAYANMDREVLPTVSLDLDNIEGGIGELVRSVSDASCSPGLFGIDDDFFENGMDSLQSVRLARLINAATEQVASNPISVSAEYIYKHPTIRLLANAVETSCAGGEKGGSQRNREAEMRALVEEFARDDADGSYPPPRESLDAEQDKKKLQREVETKIVLLTGSTGNLGAHVLSCLCRDQSVRRVICLVRPKSGIELNAGTDVVEEPTASPDPSPRNTRTNSAYARQHRALLDAGIQLSEDAWSKIQLMEGTLGQADTALGLGAQQLATLARATVTHVVHMAWPMDFNRTLTSFRPHIRALKSLVQLARASHAPQTPPVRLLFTSSIAVLRNHDPGHNAQEGVVPETTAGVGPLRTAEIGYAEAKWVCEKLLARVAGSGGQQAAADIETMTVRIGQLSGPERHGVWKTEEHIPALLKASQTISAFPRLEGTMSWLPVDRAAKSLLEVLFQPGPLTPGNLVFHLENPIRQPSQDFITITRSAMGMCETSVVVSFDDWIDRVAKAGCAPSLEHFFRHHFSALASGSVVLDTSRTRRPSRTLRGTSAVGKDLLAKYIERWVEFGFLKL